jgi:hypothetical protein
VDENKKGPYILNSEVEKATKQMWNKKVIGNDNVPQDVCKLLEEDGLKSKHTTDQQHIVYVTEEWPKDFIEIPVTASK